MKRFAVFLLLCPAIVTIAVFLIALVSVLLLSVVDKSGNVSLASYVEFFGDSRHVSSLIRSIWIATYVTGICLVVGFPVALVMSRGERRIASVITLALAVQFFSIYVVKMYGWMLVLGNNGIVNRVLLDLGIVSVPVKLMYNELGVAIGLAAAALPLMVFPINAVLQTVSVRYEEAALGLGASRMSALLHIVVPLSMPGVVSGVVLTFVFCFAAYLTPGLLGGGFFKMIGNVIYEQAVGRFNYALAAAAAVITLAVSLLMIVGVNGLSRKILSVPR